MSRSTSYYTAIFAGLYGTAGLLFTLCACAGCGSGTRRLPGDRAPSLLVTAPLPAPVTCVPPPTPPDLTPEPAPGAITQPVGPPIAGPKRGE